MKNILIFLPLYPVQQEAGMQTRVWNIWKKLAKKYQLTIICCDENITDEKHKIHEGIDFWIYPLTMPLQRYFYSLITGKSPVLFRFNKNNNIREKAIELIEKNNINLLIADHLWLAPTVIQLQKKCKLPTLLLSHGFEHHIYLRQTKIQKPINSFLLRILMRNFPKEEMNIIKQFDYLTCIDNNEKKILLKYGIKEKNINIIPNGVDINNKTYTQAQQKKIKILFLGSLDYHPNIDGINYFLDEIFPLIKSKVEITIIGRKPPTSLLLKNKNNPNINILGFVDNLNDYFDSNTICIAPLRSGAGSRLKILEYFAHSMPVISTSIGAEGIDYTKDKNIIICDKEKEFANAIDSLCQNSKYRSQLGAQARSLVETKYNWELIVSDLENFINSII